LTAQSRRARGSDGSPHLVVQTELTDRLSQRKSRCRKSDDSPTTSLGGRENKKSSC
jgi:hypothetical protein